MPVTDSIPNAQNAALQSWQPCFDGQSAAFQHWRTNRVTRQERHLESAESPNFFHWPVTQKLTKNKQPLLQICDSVLQHGYALYRWDTELDSAEEHLAAMHLALGLERTDAGVLTSAGNFSVLKDMTGSPRARFVPYSNKPMNWHTDGYYNETDAEVRCFTLHCAAPAASGGALSLMDTELLLIALYDDDPELVAILSHPQAMTLPANKDQEGHNRPDRAVPVVFQHTDGSLGTRFTTRVKNISWRCDNTKAAAERATELIEHHKHWHTRIRLARGQGIITRNILHCREAFENAPDTDERRMLRGRYLEIPHVTGE